MWQSMTDTSLVNPKPGKVYLVGAGPGDPKLITVRGLELIAAADVIVNDRLASPRLLSHARPDAEIVYVGKVPGKHHATQDEIISIIIDRARKGKSVARLKGGDPFVFGRGGEEAAALAEAGIEFEVVPGVTSAIAAPAYAGIPVTHRGLATSFCVITGHEAPGKPDSEIRWDRLACGPDTLVFLMGVENLPLIVEQLVRYGRDADTPAAVVEWGTTARQRTVAGTLSDIAAKCGEAGLTAPAVTIVGEVVRLREAISWFEKRPLFGRRIVVTRSARQASALSGRLEDLGAEVLEFPVIKFVPPRDAKPLDEAIDELDTFDWMIFTSANGVEWFIKRLLELGKDVRSMAGPRVGAIGPGTADALWQLGVRVDFVPSQFIAEAIVSEFPGDPNGRRILIPRALDAREELPEGLRSKGADVTVVSAYETVRNDGCAEDLRAAVANERVDIVTFTSASTVHSFVALLGDVRVPHDVMIACIGPITAEAAREHGMSPAVVADEYSIEGLVDAVAAAFAGECGKT